MWSGRPPGPLPLTLILVLTFLTLNLQRPTSASASRAPPRHPHTLVILTAVEESCIKSCHARAKAKDPVLTPVILSEVEGPCVNPS